jgi:hypothetical protein
MNKKLLAVIIAGCSLSASAQSNGEPIDLSVGIVDPYSGLGNGHPKGPVQAPYVTLDDHTLYIWSQHNGFTLTLIDDNDTVVYQTYLFAGVQYAVLPTTLSGSFTLFLSDDTYMYTGTIDL